MSDKLLNLFDKAVQAAVDRRYVYGKLGKLNADNTLTLQVPNRPGWLYVRMGRDSSQGVSIAHNSGGVPERGNLPVRLRQEGNYYVIESVDYSGGRLAGSRGLTDNLKFGLPKHHHRFDGGLGYEVEAKLFEPGRIRSDSGMNVYINPFRYQKVGGVWDTWTGGSIDLTSNKPAGVGDWAWVIVGIDPATNTATAVTGTGVTYATPLAIADIDAIAYTGIPCGAIKVRNDATDLLDYTLYQDIKNWFGPGGGASNFLDLTDTPDSYTSQALKGLRVNAGATGLEFTDWQPLDAELTAIAGLTSAADKVPYFTGLGTAALATLTTFGRSIIDDTNEAGLAATLPNFAYLPGRAAGQTLNGHTGSGGGLILDSTIHATKGPIQLNPTNGLVAISNAPAYGSTFRLTLKATTTRHAALGFYGETDTEYLILGVSRAAGGLTSGTAVGDSVMYAENGSLFVQADSDIHIGFYGDDRIFAEYSTGAVGIGTSTPTVTETYSRLTVSGSNATAHYAAVINTGAGQVGLGLNRTGTTPSRWLMYIPTGQTYLEFYNGANLVTFLTTGEVGIGTTQPSEKLTVNGNIHLNLQGGEFLLNVANAANDMIKWKNSGYTKFSAAIGSIGTGSFVIKGLAFYTGNDADTITDAQERMRISETGMVGIGETAPAYKLDIYGAVGSQLHLDNTGTDVGLYLYGTSASNGGMSAGAANNGSVWKAKVGVAGSGFSTVFWQAAGLFYWYANSGLTLGDTITLNEVMRLDYNAHLGLGIAPSASYTFMLDSDGIPSIILNHNAVAKSYWAVADADNNFFTGTLIEDSILYAPSGSDWWLGCVGADELHLVTNNVKRLNITSAGDVGIGVTAPGGKLGIQAGTSTNDAAAGGVLYVDYTNRGNLLTGEDNLSNYTLPANTLAVDGQSVWYEGAVRFANNANAKTLKVYFGATQIFLWSGSGALVDFWFRVRVVRTGATTQRIMAYTADSTGLGYAYYVTASATLSGTVVVKATGTGVADNDIVQSLFVVGWDDANT